MRTNITRTEYSINSILYQRGIYPAESFKAVPKYGLTVLVTKEEDLIFYLKNVLQQLSGTQYQRSVATISDASEHTHSLVEMID